MQTQQHYVNFAKAAELTNFSVGYIRQLTKKYSIPVKQFNGKFYVHLPDLETCITRKNKIGVATAWFKADPTRCAIQTSVVKGELAKQGLIVCRQLVIRARYRAYPTKPASSLMIARKWFRQDRSLLFSTVTHAQMKMDLEGLNVSLNTLSRVKKSILQQKSAILIKGCYGNSNITIKQADPRKWILQGY